MNYKFIFSVLVLLVAYQATVDAQLFSFFVDLTVAIVGTVVGVITAVTVVVISFTVNIVSLVSQVTLGLFLNLNFGLYRALLRNNATVSNVSNLTSALNSRIANCSAITSRSAVFLGSLSTASMRDATIELSYTLSASAQALVGVNAGNGPPRSPFFDVSYFASAGNNCFLVSDTTTGTTSSSLGCQALAFSAAANATISSLNRTAAVYERINRYFNASCAVPNTTSVADLVQAWTDLRTAFAAYANLTIVNGTLLAYSNATLGANVSATFNLTQNFIDGYINATSCLINAACENKRRRILNAASWLDVWWMANRTVLLNRRLSYELSASAALSYSSSALTIGLQQRNATASLQTIFDRYRSLKVQNFFSAASAFLTALTNFNANVNSSSLTINATLQAGVNVSENAKFAILSNASAIASAAATNLTNFIASLNASYPECQVAIDAVAEVQANFTSQLQNCSAAVDAAHDAAHIALAGLTANLTAYFNAVINATGSCYVTWCAGNAASNSYANAGYMCIQDLSLLNAQTTFFFGIPISTTYTLGTRGTGFVNCYGSATANLNANITAINSNLQAALINYQFAVGNATQAYSTCVQAQTSAGLSAFAQVNLAFNNCTQSSTTTVAEAATTTAEAATTAAEAATTAAEAETTTEAATAPPA